MHYIYFDTNGAARFDRYFKYLEDQKLALGDHVYSFASDPGRYYLDTPGTLHDAWLSNFVVDTDILSKPSTTAAEVRLLGPFHDRIFVMKYSNVIEYEINSTQSVSPIDLLTHEIRVVDGEIEHEYLFDKGMHLQIKCKSMQWAEVFRK